MAGLKILQEPTKDALGTRVLTSLIREQKKILQAFWIARSGQKDQIIGPERKRTWASLTFDARTRLKQENHVGLIHNKLAASVRYVEGVRFAFNLSTSLVRLANDDPEKDRWGRILGLKSILLSPHRQQVTVSMCLVSSVTGEISYENHLVEDILFEGSRGIGDPEICVPMLAIANHLDSSGSGSERKNGETIMRLFCLWSKTSFVAEDFSIHFGDSKKEAEIRKKHVLADESTRVTYPEYMDDLKLYNCLPHHVSSDVLCGGGKDAVEVHQNLMKEKQDASRSPYLMSFPPDAQTAAMLTGSNATFVCSVQMITKDED